MGSEQIFISVFTTTQLVLSSLRAPLQAFYFLSFIHFYTNESFLLLIHALSPSLLSTHLLFLWVTTNAITFSECTEQGTGVCESMQCPVPGDVGVTARLQ